jgi:predicted metal-binding protein
MHYKRNPMCPPAIPDIKRMEKIINSYQYVNIFYEDIKFNNKFDLLEKRKSFQIKLLREERRLKLEGNFYALCFFSGACAMCGDDICNLNECKRSLTGRMPVCATGIDISMLFEKILKIPKEQSISYWKPLFSKSHFKDSSNKHLCLGLVFY